MEKLRSSIKEGCFGDFLEVQRAIWSEKAIK
jgi:hypothetical protein